MKQIAIWLGALILGAILGLLGISVVNDVADVVANIYVRFFQLLAVPTIVLAIITTLAQIGTGQQTGRIFRRTLVYTLLTTTAAAAVGAVLYMVALTPEAQALPSAPMGDTIVTPLEVSSNVPPSGDEGMGGGTFADHLLSVVPNNIVRPFLEGNVLSLLLLAFAIGIGLSKLPASENKAVLLKGVHGLQDLLFLLIRALVYTLPLGIMAFSVQLSRLATQAPSDAIGGASLGTYTLVVLLAGGIQFFVVLPLCLLARGINPLLTFAKMSPAVLMALFTKSSAATLPVTMQTAEQRLGIKKEVARFVLPICTTINMNGCAAFILVTSLFTMQSGGMAISMSTVLLWTVISVVAAVGNAGVPMGCYFLTFSLMSGIGAPVAIMGLILPIYTIIDMVETAENVWSDSCVCALVNKEV